MPGSTIRIKHGDGELGAYLALPDAHRAPGVVVVSSIFGVDNDITCISDQLAKKGYLVTAPDLFWRDGMGALEVSEQGLKRAMPRSRDFDMERGMGDIAGVIRDLKSHPRCNGKIAVIGFCFGGLYAFLSAARLGINVAISFHGSHVGKHLAEAPRIQCPMSFHYGDKDPVAPMEEVERIREACRPLANASVHIYPGAGHGYMLPSRGEGYFPAEAALSWERALAVLAAM